ncbi:MAG: hypothetical protein OXS29_11450 [bacterium]|nr:hypothetical protein [bacterium]MDE0438525.1 hypothetical protein [bacterium]
MLIRGRSGAPLWVSDPYPTKGEAEGARNFALRVINDRQPLPIEGWTPAEPLRSSYAPPPPEQASATVRVLPRPHPSSVWRLQATRPDGSVIITSFPYRAAAEAKATLEFLGVLHVFAGDTERTGQVRVTTHPGDQICDCHTLGEDCRHIEPHRIEADPFGRDRGLSL